MNKLQTISISVIVGALLVGCGGSDSGGSNMSNYTVSGEPVAITNEAAAANTVASLSSVQSASSSLGSINFAPSRPSTNFAPNFKSPSLASANFTEQCSYGGTMSVNGSESGDYESGSYSGTVTYSNCDEYYMTMNGSMNVSGSYTDNYPIETWSDTISTSNLSMTSDTFSYTMNMYMTSEGSYNYATYADYNKMTMSGTMVMTSGELTMNMGFENYIVIESDDELTVDGKLSIESSINTCASGVYEFETITPLTTSYSYGYTSGKVKINGATFSFNSNGTADVTYADGTTDYDVSPSSATCN
jgi:hypothetical protein